jgi:hypothetical protein
MSTPPVAEDGSKARSGTGATRSGAQQREHGEDPPFEASDAIGDN